MKQLKSLPESTLDQLVLMYNEILSDGISPEAWKGGKLVMIKKKNPETIISNYRPICLVSVIGKLFTKIIAKRIGNIMKYEEIIGSSQMGFRQGRNTLDNIFILQSILEISEQSKNNVFMMSIDLKSAYDMVDRRILMEKLAQLGFPPQIVNFLKNYYSGDYIETSMGEAKSNKHFMGRGLRQGCNLSPVLFTLFLSELGLRLERFGGGCKIGNLYINAMLFADDIILVANTKEELLCLQLEVEQFCTDFGMMVSREKTMLIANDGSDKWPYLLIDGPHEDLLVVSKAKYLGVMIAATRNSLTSSFNDRLRIICNSYVKTILSYAGSMYSQIQSSLAIWKGVALPSMLYAVEVLDVDQKTLDYLDLQQRKLGKSLLGIPMSSANVCIETELGLRPISEIIAERKITFGSKLANAEGAELTNNVFKFMSQTGISSMYNTYIRLKRTYNIGSAIKNEMRKLGRERLETELKTKASMIGVAVPSLTALWKPLNYLLLDNHYHTIAAFRTQNTGRGNRDNSRADWTISDDQGKVKVCQLCHEGLNNEIHLLIECKAMEPFRANNFIGEYCLQEILDMYHGSVDCKYRQLMEIAAKQGNHYRKQLALGNLLKRALKEADEIWIAKLEDSQHM